jgi:hypothetical protein
VGVADEAVSYPLTNAPWSVERMHASVRSAVFSRFSNVVMISPLTHARFDEPLVS